MACDEDRPASQCGSAARWSRSISWSSTSCSGIFVLLGMRIALCPRLSIRFSFLCSRVGCRVVPAVARYFRPFLVSVGRRSPRLSRGLVAGIGTQGRWGWFARCTFVFTFIAVLESVVDLRWGLFLLVRFALSFEGSLWSLLLSSCASGLSS